MKQIISVIIFTILSYNLSSQNIKQSGAMIVFSETRHEYGEIPQNSDGCCYFYYKNTGTEPLLISEIGTNCGCTVPTWSKKPLLPGKTGKIKVKYNTTLPGEFRKIVCVKSNAVNRNPTILRIHGKVLKK